MELNRFVAILRRGWPLILVFSVVGLIGSGVAALVTPTQYSATTRLFVTIQTTGDATAGDLVAGNSFAVQKVSSYVAVASSPIVLSPVIDDLGLDRTAADLARDVTVTVAPNSAIIEISVLGGSAEDAARLTSAIADSFTDVVVDEIEAPADGSPSPVRVQVIQPAVVPLLPSVPQVPLYLAVGLVLGLALGLVVVLLIGFLDRRLRTRVDVEQAVASPVLGSIPVVEKIKRDALVTRTAPSSAAAESFRALRTNLQYAGFEGRPRTIVLASATAGEGTSTVAANLAVSLAEVGSSVVVVDADLRSSSLSSLFGLGSAKGLSDVLIDRAILGQVLVASSPRLSVLPAGAPSGNSSELLGSVAMGELLEALTAAFDYVIVDSPPVLPFTDAAVLSRMTSGTLLVVGAKQVRGDQLRAALETLERAGGSTIGLVVNRAARRGPDSDVITRATGAGGDIGRPTARAAAAPADVDTEAQQLPTSSGRRAVNGRRTGT